MATHTKTFDYTGGWQRWDVPDGVKTIHVTMSGGGSGGIAGGYVDGHMRVNGKQTLWIMVGAHGDPRSGNGNRQGGNVVFGGGGRAGDGTGTGQGGGGGGGASAIRVDSKTGRIRVVAGGAGGTSGDGGVGGMGGRETGEIGHPGNAGTGAAEAATGGTQSQPGRGGTSSIGTAFWGRDGQDVRVGRGGTGRTSTLTNTHGGGGGGGGWYPGGGGQAGQVGVAPAGGGAGGSNYVGGCYSAVQYQGTGNTGHGQVTLEWIDPDDPSQPPVPPSNIVIEGKDIQDELATKARFRVTLKGTPKDPDAEQGVRVLVRISRGKEFHHFRSFKGTYDKSQERDVVQITDLEQDTLYHVRIYSQDNHGEISANYRSTSFWTNRSPLPPTLQGPADNSTFTNLVNVTFDWKHNDPDPNDDQTAFRLRWRRSRTPNTEPGEWGPKVGNGKNAVYWVEQTTSFDQWTIDAGTFKANTLYEWQVKTRDQQNRWGSWSDSYTFYVTGATTPPLPEFPIRDSAVVASEDTVLSWRFQTPTPGTTQARADVRYAVVGSVDPADTSANPGPDWTTLFGDSGDPGPAWSWVIPADTFGPNIRYQWQVRTYGDTDSEPSDWSETAYFWATPAPSSGAGIDLLASGAPQKALGVGHNRVYVADRGGNTIIGEITPYASLQWGRLRDDISGVTLTLTSWTEDTAEFLRNIRTWQHEIVVFRDSERVWEGPITLISGNANGLTIQAKDVMAYVYRRIMRQGYNDAFRVMNGAQLGQHTVVQRAVQIVLNCLSYDDPNVLQYLTPFYAADDATTSRVVKDYSKTAWEEIDDLAATAGLDYVTSGRRIIFNDTHRAIGRLPEMRDGDFSDPPIVSEYGMSAANFWAVTDGNGVYGTSSAIPVGEDPGPTGWLEQLASAYGEAQDQQTQNRTLSRDARRKLEETFGRQALRNITGRWPQPIVVRVPDNTTLNPELNIGINQIIPGVWVPLRSSGGVREVSQWQKLDSMTVTEDASGEKISVVMSPAPQSGQDPDSDAAALEDA